MLCNCRLFPSWKKKKINVPFNRCVNPSSQLRWELFILFLFVQQIHLADTAHDVPSYRHSNQFSFHLDDLWRTIAFWRTKRITTCIREARICHGFGDYHRFGSARVPVRFCYFSFVVAVFVASIAFRSFARSTLKMIRWQCISCWTHKKGNAFRVCIDGKTHTHTRFLYFTTFIINKILLHIFLCGLCSVLCVCRTVYHFHTHT